jgi:hypothetical protein
MSEVHLKIRQIAEDGSKNDFINLLSAAGCGSNLLSTVDALLDQALHGGSAGGTPAFFDNPVEQALAQSIGSFSRRFRHSGQAFVTGSDNYLIDCHEELDPLAVTPLWNTLSYTKYFLQMKVVPRRKFAIVTSARNEGIYLHEWISFYRAIGIDGIFIYTNDNTDGSDELLTTLAQNGLIHLIRNRVNRETPIQTKVLRHAGLLLDELRDFEWVFCVDADEFFVPRFIPDNVSKTAEFFVSQTLSQAGSFSAACLNWKWFVPDQDLTYSQELVTKRFELYRPDDHVKSLSRLKDVIEFTAHIPRLLPRRTAIDGKGQIIAELAPRLSPNYALGQINHYWSKSFPEFVLKKQRGLASRGLAGEQRSYDQYFEWNRNAAMTREPFPESLSRAMVDEMHRIADLPGMNAALSNVGRNHERMLSEARTNPGYESLYATENARYLSRRGG